MAIKPSKGGQRIVFNTPEEAENHFYEAIRNNDADALIQVWADDDEIICIHREGKRLIGSAQIHESWRTILQSGGTFKIELKEKRVINNGMTVIHVMLEKITQVTVAGSADSVCHCTNIFQKGPRGWRLIVHMATAAPGAYLQFEEAKNFVGYFH